MRQPPDRVCRGIDIDVVVFAGDRDHLLGPRVADVAAHDRELGKVQRHLVDVGNRAVRSPTAAADRCGRPACRTARRLPRTRQTADSSGGRWVARSTARARPAGRRIPHLTRRRSSRTAAIGRSRSTVAKPANRLGFNRIHSATSSLEMRSWPFGPRHALSRPKSTSAASIAAKVTSIGTSASGIEPPVQRRSEARSRCARTAASGAASTHRSSSRFDCSGRRLPAVLAMLSA